MADGMSDLFSASDMSDSAPRPLADKLRPQVLADVVGQDHLLGADGALGRMLATGNRKVSLRLAGWPRCARRVGTLRVPRLEPKVRIRREAKIENAPIKGAVSISGAPGRIRTCDPCLRRAVLYPAELRARCGTGRVV